MMKTGLLWFDNDSGRDLASKVARAAAHYQKKFGRAPQLCYVNPATAGPSVNSGRDSARVAGVEVLTSKTVLPHHFWLGVKEDGQNAKRGEEN